MYFNRSVHYKPFIFWIHPVYIYINICVNIYYHHYYYIIIISLLLSLLLSSLLLFYLLLLYYIRIWNIYMCVCWYYLYRAILHPCVVVWLRSISSGDKKAQLAAKLVAKLDANDAGTTEFLARGSGAEVAPILKISGYVVRYIQYNVAMCIHAYMTSTYKYIYIHTYL